jgi:thioredoxin 1
MMWSGRYPFLILLALGWLGLISAPAVLAQGTGAANRLPEILEFDRKFCPVCKASERVIQAVEKKFPGKFTVRKLYIDEEESLFRRYKVTIVPTQVFVDAAGQEVHRHEGVFKEEELVRRLKHVGFIRD